jgi:energy-coupling factor transporter ATP-binding protein EcfA2
MRDNIKKAIARVHCGGKNGTAFLISATQLLTAYHVVQRYDDGTPISLEFLFPDERGKRSARLLNKRESAESGIDMALLELDSPIEDTEPLNLSAVNLEYGVPWKAFGFPSTKYTTGEIFLGEVSQLVEQHESKYDTDLSCHKPNITDKDYVVGGASGSPIFVNNEVVAVLSDKMPGGTLGAVSMVLARDLLTEYNITFNDKVHSEYSTLNTELAKMLAVYKLRVAWFLENHLKPPFESKINSEMLKRAVFNHFYETPTWKKNVINHVSLLSREFRNDPIEREKGNIRKLQDLCDLVVPYEQFQLSMLEEIRSILSELPDETSTLKFKQLLYELNRLLKNRYDKVLLITGESGSGKTHLLKTIISSYKTDEGMEEFSLRIPINTNVIKERGLEDSIINSINYFLNSGFVDINEFDSYVNELVKKGTILSISIIINDLQSICISNPKFYYRLKGVITEYTKYDWINWCITINELDLYLILDSSDFLERYCVQNNNENGRMDFFVSMNQLNSELKVCHKILNDYGINTEVMELFPENANNIQMLLQNPLISHVYGNTVDENEKELHNLCYFDFIKRYSEIKKREMIAISERDLPFQEQEVQIDNDIDKVVRFLINNKKLTYLEREFNELFEGLDQCYYELRSVHLISKMIVEKNDVFEHRKDIIVNFVFKLYWAYKILLGLSLADWSQYSVWRGSFNGLKDELLLYAILYLDYGFEKNEEILSKEVTSVLNSEDEKDLLFFVSIKTSFRCQNMIFDKLFEMETLALSKRETFGLMYFLMHNKSTITKKCKVLVRYLNYISKYELGAYLENVCEKMFGSISNITKLKKCISEFIDTTDISISQRIARIAANNFVRITVNEEKYDLKEMLQEHLVSFLCNNQGKITEALERNKGRMKDSTFIEYFLRYLFRVIIEINDNKFLLHEILLNENLYFLDTGTTRFKPTKLNIPIAHILRGSSAITYGGYYKHINYSMKRQFKNQYIDCMSALMRSGLPRQRVLAYHFISNTVFDHQDPNSIVDIEFIPHLMEIYKDDRINWFVKERKDFFARNINAYYPEDL